MQVLSFELYHYFVCQSPLINIEVEKYVGKGNKKSRPQQQKQKQYQQH